MVIDNCRTVGALIRRLGQQIDYIYIIGLPIHQDNAMYADFFFVF